MIIFLFNMQNLGYLLNNNIIFSFKQVFDRILKY